MTQADIPMEHLEGKAFIALAYAVLAGRDAYEDEHMSIMRNSEGAALVIERKPMPDAADWLRSSNPTTYLMKDGEIIRHHGEHAVLVPFMKAIADANLVAFPHMVAKRIDRQEFVDFAYAVLGDQKSFENDFLCIRRNYNGLDLEVTRKPIWSEGRFVQGSNPTTMVRDGEIIRQNGEYVHIAGHLEALAKAKSEATT